MPQQNGFRARGDRSTNCPHCKKAAAQLMPPMGDYEEIECAGCGVYRITGTFRRLIENGQVTAVCIVELKDGQRLLADRQNLPNNACVRAHLGSALHNGIIAEWPANHLQAEGLACIMFIPPVPDHGTPDRFTNYLTCAAAKIELGWAEL